MWRMRQDASVPRGLLLLVLGLLLGLGVGMALGNAADDRDDEKMVVERAECLTEHHDHETCRSQVRIALIRGCQNRGGEVEWVEIRLNGVVHTTFGAEPAQFVERHPCANLNVEAHR